MRILLVVDMQKSFIKMEPYFSLNEKIQSLIDNGNYDKLIFTKFINDKAKNSLFIDRLNWMGLTSLEEQELSLNVPTNSIILAKYSYGLTQEQIDYIKSLNVNEIDICGVQAEACVYAIALQLWDNGIYPNILINYVLGEIDMKNIFIKQFGK